MTNQPPEGYEYWAEHPDFPLHHWKDLVASEDTRLGYWEWVKTRMGW